MGKRRKLVLMLRSMVFYVENLHDFEIIESCSYFYMVSSSYSFDFVMAVIVGMVFSLIRLSKQCKSRSDHS